MRVEANPLILLVILEATRTLQLKILITPPRKVRTLSYTLDDPSSFYRVYGHCIHHCPQISKAL